MEKPYIVAVYGSLLKDLHNHDVMTDLGPEHYEFVGTTKTEPTLSLYSLGGYPGVIEGGNTAVVVELYKVSEALLKTRLDRLEGYIEASPEQSFYIRKPIQTELGESLIYVCNRIMTGRPLIEDGDWRNYIQNK